MNVLSLFDGMSCGQIALNRCGIKYDNYYASEIDKYAMQVTMANYPNTIQVGDVSKVIGSDLPKIDLLIGGSPCQGFSFAGKGLNFEDERSKLFFEYVRLLKECEPIYFLLENVKMKKEHEQVISNILGVRPIRLNSALVSAQNRERLYWTNIPVNSIPVDKMILLNDILESEGIGVIKNMGNYTERPEKGMCLDANYFKGADNHGQRTLIRCLNNSDSQAKRVYDVIGKGPTINGNHSRDYKIFDKNKANTLTPDAYLSVGKRNRDHEGKSILTSMHDRRIRKLTPLECERLQTVPDNYTKHVSNTQRFKMLGNGWTIDIICHILNFIK